MYLFIILFLHAFIHLFYSFNHLLINFIRVILYLFAHIQDPTYIRRTGASVVKLLSYATNT